MWIRGFKELLERFNAEHGSSVNYHALDIHVKGNLGALVKTTRKSHVEKDPEKVTPFKKTSGGTAASR
ncbi:MAG: hypothetical protein CR994_04880 [Maribacter sp.]|nr:MAG: hypothetical protein CR994_04880 [Maribacter sp.]